jgi:hypothetical protein
VALLPGAANVWRGAAKRPAKCERPDTGRAQELSAKTRPAAKADQFGDALHRLVRCFEQLLCATNSLHQEPLERARAEGRSKAPGQCSLAHPRGMSEFCEREALVEVLDRPIKDLGKSIAAVKHRCLDVLRLPARAMGRNHQPARKAIGYSSAVILSHELNAKVEAGRRSRRRED